MKELGCDEIDTTALQQRRELALDGHEVQAGHVPRLKFHQDVDVTIGLTIAAKHGAKDREASDVMPATKSGQRLAIEWNVDGHGLADHSAPEPTFIRGPNSEASRQRRTSWMSNRVSP